MTTEVLLTTTYDTIIIDDSVDTVLVENEGQTVTIVTSAEQGPQGPSGAMGPISSAPDVDVTNLVDGSLLIYSAQDQKWVANTQLTNQSLESGHY
jgi:hypothetical protein